MPPCPAGPESTWMESRYISCSAAIIAKRVFLPMKTTTATCTGWEQRAVNSECALHAYGLMTNPVHLLLTPKKAEAHCGSSSPWGGVTCHTSTAASGAPALCGIAATSPR